MTESCVRWWRVERSLVRFTGRDRMLHAIIDIQDDAFRTIVAVLLNVLPSHDGEGLHHMYRDLFHGDQRVLESHRGYDPGALVKVRALAAAFAAPLVASTVSRLLVDLNRSVGHPRLYSEAIREAPAEVRQRILKHYCQPYRAQTERLVRQGIVDDGLVIHLSSQSFTPELDGKVRDSDIGLLYD